MTTTKAIEKVYLKNGQEANLIKEIDGQYLVDPYEYYQGYEGEDYSEASGSLQIVDKVFKSPPLPVIDEEYQRLIDQIQKVRQESIVVQGELFQNKQELERVKKITTDASKYIINREEIKNAKRITYFGINNWLPSDWQGKMSNYDLKIQAYITLSNGNEDFWEYKLYEDYNSSGYRVDSKYGFLLDKTDEEIDAITKERIANYESVGLTNILYENRLVDVDDKFLSDKLIAKKNNLITDKNEKDKLRTEKEIADLTEKLERLKTQGGIYPSKRRR